MTPARMATLVLWEIPALAGHVRVEEMNWSVMMAIYAPMTSAIL